MRLDLRHQIRIKRAAGAALVVLSDARIVASDGVRGRRLGRIDLTIGRITSLEQCFEAGDRLGIVDVDR